MRAFAFVTILACVQPALAQNDRWQREEFRDYANSVGQVIQQANEVAANGRERSDVRTLQFLLRDLNKAISANDWKNAAQVRNRMKVALARGGNVAADAPRRKADQEEQRRQEELAIRERQHQEAMRQRERIHQEDLRQRYLLNQQQHGGLPQRYDIYRP